VTHCVKESSQPNSLSCWVRFQDMIYIRAEHFQFGPVLDQNKQPNRFLFYFLNRTEPKTGSNRLISVRFGFFPFQTGSNLNFYTCFHFPKNQLQFSFCSPCPEVEPIKKIHKTKGFACKKTKRKSKVIEM
jgi:hypothetical protein